ncbi:MAG: molybdopterin-dependent oxidoreductase [Thermodesulfobacteriota bacterium]
MKKNTALRGPLAAKISGPDTGIQIHKTFCSICNAPTHCGIDAYVLDGSVIKVEGSESHPHNQGALCSKGSASRQYVYHKDRLRTPLLRKGERGSGDFVPISWEEALDTISRRLLRIKEETGPESVVFYAGYTKWFRPFLKRLAHSFGSPNYCTESSTCHQATALAAKLNYGYFGGPDLKNAKCLLVWSYNPFHSNTAITRRLVQAVEKGLKIIEVGPLITPMTRYSTIHLRIRPGTSGALALGMAHVIVEEGLYDRGFVDKWTHGFEEYRNYVREFSPVATEEITGVPADLIVKAARLYATTKPAALLPSASPTVHHTNGVQNHRALTALIGLTGNFDRPGGNYVVPPTWLNISTAAPAREDEFKQVRAWKDMPPRVGEDLYPVWCGLVPEAQAMHVPFQIRSGKPYPIRAMLAFGMRYRMWPGSDFMLESLQKLDFLVNVDLFMTETCRLSDILLPACTTFERSELRFWVENFVMWSRPAIRPLYESRSDADIIFDLAKRMLPDDGLMQRGYEASIDWILKPSGLTVAELKEHPAGLHLKDFQMPPFRKYEDKGFPTPTGKMEFTSTVLKEAGLDPLPRYQEPRLSPRSTPELAKKFPLVLTTGARLPMYVHSRTFRLGWDRGLRPDPNADINPADAAARGISDGDRISLSTPRASLLVRANLTEVVPPGVVSFYHAWPEADANLLIEPDYLDPISAYPGFKSQLCEVSKV